MKNSRRYWTRELKLKILMEIEAGKTVAALGRQYNVAPVQIYNWKRLHEKYGEEAFKGNGHAYTEEARVAELERKIGQLTMDNDLLKKANNVLREHCQVVKSRGKI